MKKLFILYVALLMVGSVVAQNTPVTMTGTATLTNADTVNLTQTVKGVYKTISFQPVITKYSGTVAGTAILQGSVDGTNFVDLNTDTLSLANQTTNTSVWTVEGSNYYYYRIQVITTGTVSAQAKGYIFTSAQSGANHSVVNMKASDATNYDTVTNTGTGYVELQVKGTYNSVSIQVLATKISGTNAGTVTLQGSNDGTNFVTVDTAYITVIGDQAPYSIGNTGDNTLTVTDVAVSTKIFVITGSPYAYYRVSHTGSGTMSSQLSAKLMPNR